LKQSRKLHIPQFPIAFQGGGYRRKEKMTQAKILIKSLILNEIIVELKQ